MKTFLLLSFLLGPPLAHASPESNPDILFAKLTSDLLSNNEGGDCSLRSDVWAYELEKLSGKRPSKILLLYTQDSPSRQGWVFHIAPALKLETEWTVFEAANGISSPLSVSEWMKQINGPGQECMLMNSVPDSVIQFFNRSKAGFGEYDPDTQTGPCMAFRVDADVSKPEDGFLNFIPNAKVSRTVHGRDKAIESCATFSGRYRFGGTVVNGQRVKTSAFKDEILQARAACEQAIDRGSND